MTKYQRCIECDKLLPKIKSRRQNQTRCNVCVKSKFLGAKKINTTNWKKSEHCEEESVFEDDPKAVYEKDYGRITKKSTYMFTRTIIDDFG
tara:strand:+ start:282 stop:554 length:273 start_codon:yes stop_codon:yes gene_type:complete